MFYFNRSLTMVLYVQVNLAFLFFLYKYYLVL